MLEAAYAHGIRHFDCARMYGDGLAERSLGRFADNRRDRIVIATKAGIDANPYLETAPWLGYPFRVLRRLGRLVGWVGQTGAYPNDRFSAPRVAMSLLESLASLRTDYVDVLFLHEPGLDDIDAIRKLEGQARLFKAEGRVIRCGLAGARAFEIAIQLGDSAWCDVIQGPIGMATTQAPCPGTSQPTRILYGVHSIPPGEGVVSQSHENEGRPTSPAAPLRHAIANNPGSMILYSSRKIARLNATLADLSSGAFS